MTERWQPFSTQSLAARAGHWQPLGTRSVYGPPPIGLIAHRHGVWQVLSVVALERALWNESDEQCWLDLGMPDPWSLGQWTSAPYRVEVRYVGGVNPHQIDAGAMTVHSTGHKAGGGTMLFIVPRDPWHAYPGTRWPACSCCGQPVPCTAELLDRQVDAGLTQMERHAAKLPGCCWSCGEPISSRQASVVYAGTNLDSPAGPEVRFHTRRTCAHSAERYETRWRTEDPTRPRYLTWPHCPGTLLTHQDRTQECVGGGLDTCLGHTHTHAVMSSCTAQSHGCGRGCGSYGHPGALGPHGPKAVGQ